MHQDNVKSHLRVYLIAGTSVLGCFFFGYALAYMNVSLDTVNTVFDIKKDQQNLYDGLISSLVPIGAAIGAFLSGPLLALFSRRNSMIVTDIIGAAGIGLGFVINLYTLLVARFILGLAVGLNSALIPLYIKEYTPLLLRGTAGAMNQITVNIGILVPSIVGFGYPEKEADGTNENNYWKIVFLIPIVPCILRTLLLLFVYNENPPGYYVSIGDENKALDVLSKIYQTGHVDEQLRELQREEKQKKQSSSKYSDLFKPLYKSRFIVGCLLCVLQQFCGINAVIFYSTKIFESITDNTLVVNVLNITVGLLNIVFSMAAGLLMKSYGRKSLLLFGDLMCCASLGALSLFAFLNDNSKNQIYQILIITFLFLFIIGFQLSLGPITWIYIAEILPEKGVSLAVLTNWVCTSIVTFAFLGLKEAAGISACFLIFCGCCFVGFFFIFFMVKETKGKRAVSIDNMYSMQGKLVDSEDTQTYNSGY